MNLPPAIFLMGPTASGKTGLAVALRQRLPVELISVDSALVFKEMDVGTAKPDSETLAIAPHALIDIIPPTDVYSAAQFRQDALQHMAEITARGNVPLLVGGTMLYFKALLEGLSSLPEADPEIRERIEQEAKTVGWPEMHKQLLTIDPDTAARIKPNDTQRIERALEVYRVTGKTMTELHQLSQGQRLPYQTLQMALLPSERAVLHQRIEQRLDLMLSQGFESEVRGLLSRYPKLNADYPSMRCVGYRQALEYIDGECDYETFRLKSIFATRQLAKRQMTWLRGMQNTEVYDCLDENLLDKVVLRVQEFMMQHKKTS